jgi:S1-C subfamily serine protease
MKLIKILKIITTIVLLVSIHAGCANVKENVKLNKESFTYLTQHVRVSICGSTATERNRCIKMDPKRFSASGSIIKNIKDSSFILTAGHFCTVDRQRVLQVSTDPETIKKIFTRLGDIQFETFIEVLDGNEVTHKAEVVASNQELDVCILKTTRINATPLKLATASPAYGEQVWNIVSPMGIIVPGTAPVLTGIFSGDAIMKDGQKVSVITDLPAVFGCSGSPVLNSRGELIGMIYSTNAAFNNLSYAVPLSELRKFIEKVFIRNISPQVTGNTTLIVEEPK